MRKSGSLLKYFVKEGFRNLYINGFMSFASVVIMVCCFVMTGIVFLIYQNIQVALKNIEFNNNITVYIKENSSQDLENLKSEIEDIPNVAACNIYPKSDALENYKEVLGDSINDIFEEDENPFPDALKVSMEDLSYYEETVKKITDIPEVDSVSDRSEIAKKLAGLKRLVSTVGFWITIGLAAVSMMLISNTVRITMYNRRFEISIMKSVGATNAFIRSPFIVEGLIIGLISAAFSSIILKLISTQALLLISSIIPLDSSLFDVMLKKIFVYFFIAGSILGIFSSIISIKKYLKQEGGMAVAW
ncbi:MAG: permease-like cell division protein FtsX [Clostridia bacterium]|nr:permease-like cell division protein FtsX [Clostridia bacterium]